MDRRESKGRDAKDEKPSLGRLSLKVKTDLALMKLVREGYEQAFTTLVERYTTRLTKTAARLVGSDHAPDAVQHALIGAHNLITDPSRDLEKVNIEAWLIRTVRNRSIDILRSQSFLVATADMTKHVCSRGGSATTISERERFSNLTKQIGELPERQREVLLMREFEGRSYEEIAELLDTSPGAVNQLLIRARDALRDGLGLLLPLPLLRGLLEPSRFNLFRNERVIEWMNATTSSGIAAKAAVLAVTAGAMVAGTGALERNSGSESKRAPEIAQDSAKSTPAYSQTSKVDAPKQSPEPAKKKVPVAAAPVDTPQVAENVQKAPEQQRPDRDDSKAHSKPKSDVASTPTQDATSVPESASISVSPSGTSPREDLTIDRPEIVFEDANNAGPNDLMVARLEDSYLITEQNGEPIDISGSQQACAYDNGRLDTIRCDRTYQGREAGMTVRAGDGDDRIYITTANPNISDIPAVIVQGGPGDDQIVGGEGEDWLSGGPGKDVIWGNDGIDLVDGGTGFLVPDPGDGPDALFGGDGPDWMFGDAGDDRLDGGAGDDRLHGMNGSDRMTGGPGRDFASGLEGRDIYDLRDGEKDSRHCEEKNDTLILDPGLDSVAPDWSGECPRIDS